jgi:deoxycytidylate deaminase
MEPPPYRSARRAAKKSKARYRMGAAIARRNHVLVSASNSSKTCPTYGSGKFDSLHAEGHAIKKAVRQGIDISGCDIYVYRWNDNLAAPCPDCMTLIKKYGITGVYHS